MLNDYNKLIREHFDISDTPTRKCIVALEDAEQTQLLTALTSALYDKIVEKVDEIDFGSIPNSRGDITKVEGFDSTVECLNIIRKIVIEYKENPDVVDNVLAAIENIRNRKAMFMKAYALNVEFPMVLYNLTVMSIEESVSFLIAVCIQYIKDPTSQSMNAALDKVAYNNSRSNLLYEQLAQFNKSCATKELDSAINEIMKNGGRISEGADVECNGTDITITIKTEPSEKQCSPFLELPPAECGNGRPEDVNMIQPGDEPIHEEEPDCGSDCGTEETSVEEVGVAAAIGTGIAMGAKVWAGAGVAGKLALGTAAAVGAAGAISMSLKVVRILLGAVIPMMRNMVYFLYNSRMKLSDSLSVQAQFLEANAYKLQYTTNTNLDDTKRAKVVEKQLKIAEKMKKLANTFAIKNKKAEKEARELAVNDMKKMKIEDIKDQLPADIYTKSVLF